ncbi:probable serine/threonine-protein kinase irlB [Daphnia magna]|uniref:probable serine/threonine-protein kinase irlB n=1 Tax=Daphnia magna TaxID=35525 RepID=UPI001E1B9F8D|nr:probable serine/threonine-protein kinase irlB [Daphnia magna]
MEGKKITFERNATLGKGAYGYVFRGKFEGIQVAVKRVLLDGNIKRNEEECLKKLKHPNIIKLFHSESDDDFIFYALELCDASLDQLFLGSDDPRKYNGPMPPDIVVFLQLALGLEYIHFNKLIHRDIKPANILISVRSTDRSDEVTIKWADFGLSRAVNERGTFTLSEIKGTAKWRAPESLKLLENAQEEDEPRGTVQSDVFVLCLVFGYLLLKGDHLYGSKGDNVEKNIRKGNPVNMQKINGELRNYYEYDLLRKMLEDDPQKRITSKEVVKQLKSINKMLTKKREEELRQLCARDSPSDLIEKIKDLIHLGIDVNAKDEIYGRNALHYLCRFNSNSNLIDAIQLLIREGIDVNAKGNDGRNALHYLCRNKTNTSFIGAMQTLIEKGIDVNATNKYGENALHLLCGNYSTSNSKEAIRILIQNGIRVIPNGNDPRSILRKNNELSNTEKKEILKLLDEMKIKFDQRDKLGSGGYGSMFRGELKNDAVCLAVAVKRVLLNEVNANEEKALRELETHQNIVQLFHCESDDNFRYYAMELCNASLDQLFLNSNNPKKYNGPMPPNIEVFRQLAEGLKYIHFKQLFHRDIKPENVLIKRPPRQDDETIIKWADFGLSKDVNERGTRTLSGIKGTNTWFAPESLKNAQEAGELRGTVKSDVFVLGLVVGYLFLNGKHLYGNDEIEIHYNIKEKRPIKIGEIATKLRECNAYNILSHMLEDDLQIRITSAQVVDELSNSRGTAHTPESNNHLDNFLLDSNRIAREEKSHRIAREEELRRLCALENSSDLTIEIENLIKKGIDIKAKDRFRKNALHILCELNSSSTLIDAIILLIEQGIDVNAKGNHELNALHYLCRNKTNPSFVDAMKTLIEKGIDVNATNKYGENALHLLCGNYSTSNSKEAIRILIQNGIRVIPNGNDPRSILRKNNELSNTEKKEILKLLDKAALTQG